MIRNKHSLSNLLSTTHLGLARDRGPVAALQVELALADALQDHLGAVFGAVGEGRSAARQNMHVSSIYGLKISQFLECFTIYVLDRQERAGPKNAIIM